MTRSLGLILVVVAVTLVFVPGLLHPSKSQRLQAVDYGDVVVGFKQVTGQLALAPSGLPAPWRATSRSLTHKAKLAHLHIGFAAPQNRYAGLEESNGPSATFVGSVIGARGRTETATTTLNGGVWSIRTSQRGETSLVRSSGGLTVVITGSASLASEQALARSLRPSAH